MNEFVCEYEGNVLTPSEAKQLEEIYRDNDDPIYMLQVRENYSAFEPDHCRPLTDKDSTSLMRFHGSTA